MTPEQLQALIPRLPPGTEISYFRIRLPGDPPQPGVHDFAPPPNAPVAVTPADPDAELKVRPTSRRSGISERELRKAIKHDFLSYRPKRGGRDDGAHLIEPDALERYLVRREGIRVGAEVAPEHWPGPVEAVL